MSLVDCLFIIQDVSIVYICSYGDKTPRSVIGRLFSVLWIFVGITIVSFFTATITSAITIATVKNPCETLENRTVSIIMLLIMNISELR